MRFSAGSASRELNGTVEELIAFGPQHREQAAALLARRQQQDREREPLLPACYESPDVAEGALARELRGPRVSGIAALRDGRVVGFLLGAPVVLAPDSPRARVMRPRSAVIPYAGYAAAEDARETYHRLYAALAPRWLQLGLFAHSIELAAADRKARAAFWSLGFALERVTAVRETVTAPAVAVASGLVVSEPAPEEADVVRRFGRELARHHAGSPIFLPFLPELDAPQPQAEPPAQPSPGSKTLLAYVDRRPVGMMVLRPTGPGLETPEASVNLHLAFVAPGVRAAGVGASLLSHALHWAADAGYSRCTVDWYAANLSGGRFWENSGYRHLSYRLTRVVDERIAWANGGEPQAEQQRPRLQL